MFVVGGDGGGLSRWTQAYSGQAHLFVFWSCRLEYFRAKMVRPVLKFDNRSTEMEIKALKLSSECKDNLRAPAIWEKPTAAIYNYHYDIAGLYYQVKTLL